MISWETGECSSSRRCSYRGRAADLWSDGKNWNLSIQTITRITKERYDVSIGWSKRMCPFLEEAILTAEEILRLEWELS